MKTGRAITSARKPEDRSFDVSLPAQGRLSVLILGKSELATEKRVGLVMRSRHGIMDHGLMVSPVPGRCDRSLHCESVVCIRGNPEDTEGDCAGTKSINRFLLECVPPKQSVSDSDRFTTTSRSALRGHSRRFLRIQTCWP
jgi:hypothetical protein